MNVNFSQPSFHGKYLIKIKNNKKSILSLMSLSMDEKTKIKPAKRPGDFEHGGLNYIVEVPDEFTNFVEKNFEHNNIKFYKLA